MATSLRELESLLAAVEEVARMLRELIRVERGEQQRADQLGEPLPRRRIS